MVSEQQKKYLTGSTITVLVLLSIFGFIPEADDTHICFDDFNEGGDVFATGCDRLSSTDVTCYPNKDNNRNYERCYSGWKAINRTGESLKSVAPAKPTYICNPKGCEQVKDLESNS